MCMNNLDVKSDDVTIVIPTLGGACLVKTLKAINAGTLIPKDIIICIPSEYEHFVSSLRTFINVRILATAVKGQVAQRAEGLKVATHDIVIQLDDDIILDANALSILIKSLKSLGHGNVVGPIYCDQISLRPIHKEDIGLNGLIAKIFYTLVCGSKWGKARRGTITPAGIGFGVDKCHYGESVIQTEWLPGGCIASYRNDLITKNFYPFAGKAFYEDFIHSHLRTEAGIKQWVVCAASCRTEAVEPIIYEKDLFSNRLARRYYARLHGYSKFRLYLYETIEWIRFYSRLYLK